MATLQRTGLGNLKGKHIATFVRKHSHNHENSEEGDGGPPLEGKDHLWLTSLLAVIFADQQSWVSPLDIEICIDRDAEVLV